MSQDPFSLDDFHGSVRLFPLPNLVLFPHAAQPLHIFEPRYRQLMADALQDDRLIAMALLRPGWEEVYHERPPIYRVVCLGRILHEEGLADGRYNLLLNGLSRARIREELPASKLYRIARVELIQDIPVSVPATEETLRQTLGRTVTPYFSEHPPALEQVRRLLESRLPLGDLCDIFSFALPLGVEAKQELLEEAQVEGRVRLLLHRLESCTPPTPGEPPPRRFPPGFSDN